MKSTTNKTIMKIRSKILLPSNRLKNCWLSLLGPVRIATLVTLRTKCQSTTAIVAGSASLSTTLICYLIAAASIAICKRTRIASTRPAKLFVTQEHVRHVTSMWTSFATAARNPSVRLVTSVNEPSSPVRNSVLSRSAAASTSANRFVTKATASPVPWPRLQRASAGALALKICAALNNSHVRSDATKTLTVWSTSAKRLATQANASLARRIHQEFATALPAITLLRNC